MANNKSKVIEKSDYWRDASKMKLNLINWFNEYGFDGTQDITLCIQSAALTMSIRFPKGSKESKRWFAIHDAVAKAELDINKAQAKFM